MDRASNLVLTASALIAVIMGVAGSALAQTLSAPLESIDTPGAPATALTVPASKALPEVASPAPLAIPPASIDDILNQSTDVEPDQPQPTPTADIGLSAELLDVRIRGASAAAQVMQGPLDGAWSLQDPSGALLYTFQFVHAAGPGDALEGAWRDHQRGEGLGGTGLIDEVRRTANMLQASFSPKGGVELAAVSLIERADGGWNGQLTQGGTTTPVSMIRSEPMLTVEPIRVATAGVVSPYRAPVNAAPARPAVKKAPVKRRVVKKAPVRKKAPARKG
jgi:hypothetical protein